MSNVKSQSINKTRKKAYDLLLPNINNTIQKIPNMTCVGSLKFLIKSKLMEKMPCPPQDI
jgi:hypothetical protein